MDDSLDLHRVARQIIETDLMLGGDFIPRHRNPLPAGGPVGFGEAAGSVGDRETAPADADPLPQTAAEKAEALAELRRQVEQCDKCGLCGTRTNVVFGEGRPDAELVFVGEAPGEEEDRQGRPFVGRAGELLTKMISAMGLTRDEVYICNVLKCRPPGNRPPNPEEVQSCWSHLVRQLEIIAPKVIVTLGNPATHALLNTTVGITRLRGQWQALPAIGRGLEGTAVMPTFHPAYLLRSYTPQNRQMVWSDLQQVMDKLGLQPGRG